MARRRIPGWLVGLACSILVVGALSGSVACKGVAKAVSHAGDDVARAAGRSADEAAGGAVRAGASSGDSLLTSALTRAGVRAAALPRHASWLAWGTFDEYKPTGRGVLRFGIYESGSKKAVATQGKVTVYSSRSKGEGDLIHTEEIAFTEGEAATGVVTRYSTASWRTWAGLDGKSGSAQFWVGMVIEADGKQVPVARETPPT